MKFMNTYKFLFSYTFFWFQKNGQDIYSDQLTEQDGNLPDSELSLMTEVSKKIEFYKNTYVLTLESVEAIERIATLLEQNPTNNLVVSGH